MAVALTSHRRCPGVRGARVRADAARLLRALRVEGELSVALVGDAEMHRLNTQYRHVDKPTDVLAFAPEGPSLDSSPPAGSDRRGAIGWGRAPGAPHLLGDVVISLDTAVRQAAERGKPVAEEVRTLLVHGVLHLLGYDHERSRADARRMFRKQRQLLALLRTA